MAVLQVEILEFWHAGSSRGSGVAADASCLRDRDGLPYLPGRHLKGLVRDAVDRCPLVEGRVAGKKAEQVLEALFGSRGVVHDSKRKEPEIEERTARGALAFGNAVLPEALRFELRHGEKRLVPHLFTGLSQTAVEHGTGVAETRSLRRTEVVVPLTLQATVEWVGAEPESAWPWQAILKDALPLVMAVGRMRSRGLGRCRMRLLG